MQRVQRRMALWVGVALLLVMVASGTIFAAGEQLRGTVAAGGSSVSSNGLTLRGVAGSPVGGSSISSSSGLGLCSGFGCATRAGSDDDGGGGSSGKKLYLPNLRRTGP